MTRYEPASYGINKEKQNDVLTNGSPNKSPCISIPYDHCDTGKKDISSYCFTIDNKISKLLWDFVQKDNVRLQSLFIAALEIVISGLTNNNDLKISSQVNLSEKEKLYRYILLNNSLNKEMSFEDLLNDISKQLNQDFYNPSQQIESIDNDNYSVSQVYSDILLSYDMCNTSEDTDKVFNSLNINIFISIHYNDSSFEVKLAYNSCLYNQITIQTISNCFSRILEQSVTLSDVRISEFQLLSQNEINNLYFSNTNMANYPKNKTLHKLFEEQVDRTPDNIAVVFEDKKITYRDLDKKSNQLANYLTDIHKIEPDGIVAIFMDKTDYVIVAALGILKAGGAYLPIDPDYPENRIKMILDDSKVSIIISTKKHIDILNKLQWECQSFKSFICLDSENIYEEDECKKNEMMDEEVWEFVGGTSRDDIEAGSWINSYTGQPFSKKEVDEYAVNTYQKLLPYFNKSARVLEIGCGSGLSMYKICPDVGLYYGTDMSKKIIIRNYERIEREHINNIKLKCLAAHEIDLVEEKDFDIVIINSVIQCFHGHNYLRKVISKAIKYMGDKGVLFIGDVMSLEKKEDLIKSLIEFKENNHNPEYRTKTEWNSELFVSNNFFYDLKYENKEINNVTITDKIRTVENELTLFRYDVLIEIDKQKGKLSTDQSKKHKIQHGADILSKYSEDRVNAKVTPNNLAYIIYTSGTTGIPKGAMIEHRNIVSLMCNDKMKFEFNDKDVWTMYHSFCFDFSVWEMYGALLFGGKVIVIPKSMARDQIQYLKLLKKEGVTVLNQTPSAFYNLIDIEMDYTQKDLNIRYVIFGGEALKPIKLKKWKEKYPDTKLVNMYGITETTVHVTYKEINDIEIENNISNIGKPLETFKAFIMNEHQKLLPIGFAGELCVSGEGVCRGYLNKLELTAQKFIENPYVKGEKLYRSGDLVRVLPNKELEYLGRIDNQVKIRGHRIELGEIEATIQKYPFVKDVIVLEKEDSSGDKALAAYVRADECNLELLNNKKRYKLPNNMAIFQLNKNETDFMYKEIFMNKNYFKHGINIKDGDCVFDVGANIGMFTLFVNLVANNVRTYSFEPIPYTYDVLNSNAKLYCNNTKTYNCGLSDFEKTVAFTFYPKASVMSSCYGNQKDDKDVFVKSIYSDEDITQEDIGSIDKYYGEFIDDRFNSEIIDCQLRTVSSIIKENDVKEIDLLKIDVEKSELDVLNGIENDDWNKIKQIVIEVHDINNQVEKVSETLEKHCFKVIKESEPTLDDTGLYTVFGIRNENTCFTQIEIPMLEDTILTAEKLKSYLNNNLPAYMIPAYIFLMDQFPMTSNGKIDKKSLPNPTKSSIGSDNEFVVASSDAEIRMEKIWKEILKIDKISINDDFFEIGGQSLKAAILLTRIHKEFDVELPLNIVYNYPTIAKLVKYVENSNKSIFQSIEVAPKMDYYPVTSIQKRMFIDGLSDSKSTEYNVQTIMLIEGAVDVERFENAFRKLIQRHEILRTSFDFKNGDVVQKVHDNVTFNIEYIEALEKDANKLITDFIRYFDLSEPHLLRVMLAKFTDTKYLFVLDVHHIVTDGVSMDLLIREFEALYLNRQLPELRIQYKDYALWYNQLMKSETIKNQEKYWMEVFSQKVPPLNFLTDYPRPDDRSLEGDIINIKLNKELSKNIYELGKDTGCTLYMVLLSAFFILLHKYTGKEDIVISSGNSGRIHSDVSSMMGIFINTLMMRNYPCADKTYLDFIQEVKTNTLQVYTNQSYPYEELISKIDVDRENGRIPMNDIVFVVENMDLSKSEIRDLKFFPKINIEGLKFKPFDSEMKLSRTDIFLSAIESDGDIILTLEYCKKLFKHKTMETLLMQYIKILKTIIQNKNIKLRDIEVVDDRLADAFKSFKEEKELDIDFDF